MTFINNGYTFSNPSSQIASDSDEKPQESSSQKISRATQPESVHTSKVQKSICRDQVPCSSEGESNEFVLDCKSRAYAVQRFFKQLCKSSYVPEKSSQSAAELKEVLQIIEKDLATISSEDSVYSSNKKQAIIGKRLEQLNQLEEVRQLKGAYGEDISQKIQFLKEQCVFLQEQVEQNERIEGKKEQIFASDLTPLNQILSDQHLTPEDLSLLKTLTKYYDAKKREEEPVLSPTKREQVAHLINKCLGNMTINKQMVKLLKNETELEKLGISKEVAELIKRFSFLTRNPGKAVEVAGKAEELIKKMHEGQDIEEHEKLSIEEMGLLDAFSKIHRIIDLIKEFKLTNLQQLVLDHKRVHLIHGQIENKLNKHSNYRDGDLIFQNYHKISRFRGVEENKGGKLRTWALASPLHHAAVCYKGEGESDKVSHILTKYEQEDFDLRDKMTMTGYRFDPSLLVNPEMKSLIAEMFHSEGKAATAIRHMYEKIQNEIHSENRFEGVVNGISRSKIFLAKIFQAMHGMQERKNYPASLHQEIMGKVPEGVKMLCSEFAAKTIIAGLFELEQNMQVKLLSFLVKKKGWSEADAKAFMAQHSIFQMPIDQTENFAILTPPLLLERLSDHGCIKRIAPAPLLKSIVKKEDLKIDSSEINLTTQTITGRVIKPEKVDEYEIGGELLDLEAEPPTTLSEKWIDAYEGTIQQLKKQGKLYPDIRKRRADIESLVATWKEQIPDTEMNQHIRRLQKRGNLTAIDSGMSGTYVLSDKNQQPRYIVKPADEALLTLNNPKRQGTPFAPSDPWHRVRTDIPLYTTVQKSVLAYEVAQQIGLADITPKTEAAIFKNSAFHDISDIPPKDLLVDMKPRKKEVVLNELLVQEFGENYQDIILNDLYGDAVEFELEEYKHGRKNEEVIEKALIDEWGVDYKQELAKRLLNPEGLELDQLLEKELGSNYKEKLVNDETRERISRELLLKDRNPNYKHDFLKKAWGAQFETKIMNHLLGEANKEKLCSVQKFIPNAKDLFAFFQELKEKREKEDLTSDQFLDYLEHVDVEDLKKCVQFMWVIGESDGNMGNFMVYEKSKDLFGIMKVDNELCFGENNREFSHDLFDLFPHLDRELTEADKQSILKMKSKEIAALMEKRGETPSAIEACKTRIAVLKEFARKEKVTFKEIDSGIRAIKPVERTQTTNQPANEKLLMPNSGGVQVHEEASPPKDLYQFPDDFN